MLSTPFELWYNGLIGSEIKFIKIVYRKVSKLRIMCI